MAVKAKMKVLLSGMMFSFCIAQLDIDSSVACSMLQSSMGNKSKLTRETCDDLHVTHSESVSGGYCLASMTAAGYYRAGSVNPIVELISELSGKHGNSPSVTGSNSGGTMFIIRYFAYRDIPVMNKWTYPCYLLNSVYKSICFFHGNFGVISEECYSETQNLVSVAIATIYGVLQQHNGGPLGVVASYCSVYFIFLANLPISADQNGFISFWTTRAHWNSQKGFMSNWVAAFSLVHPLEASNGVQSYDYGWNSYLSRGMSASSLNDWYSNVSVYTAASISANTLSGINMIPFSFAGKAWDTSTDASGASSILKMLGLITSFVMMKKMISQHTVLITRQIQKCEGGCPILDGGFTDNGPITPVLAIASQTIENLLPRQLSLLGPSSTMGSIEYILGRGAMTISNAGINLCPFTQIGLCNMMTTMRKLVVPLLPMEVGESYRDIAARYSIFRPDQQSMKPSCSDPLIFDHFQSMCEGDGICHMYASSVPGILTAIRFSVAVHNFVLSMLWLAPTHIASRFVFQYIPQAMLNIKYYSNMDTWFPDFVATAPQKGGVGFTKVAGHSLLDFLTYLVQRMMASEISIRVMAFKISAGFLPSCGYHIFAASQKFNSISVDQLQS